MKQQTFTLIFTIILMHSLSTSLHSQWESIGSGISTGQKEYFSISVVDENHIWAVPNGSISTSNYEYTKSSDGGETWEEGSLPDSIGSYFPGNIYALNKDTVWILMIKSTSQDHIKIFKTQDGGDSWEEQDGEFNEKGHAFAALHFFNENEGVGFGSPGTGNQFVDSLQIFKTADGGENWNRIPPSTLPEALDDDGVWVSSGNSSYEVKGDSIWFVTRAGRVFRSIDKGETWDAFEVNISAPGFNQSLVSIAFENSMNGIVSGIISGRAARTNDGGETWKSIQIPPSIFIGAIEYIPGTKSTYLTNDGTSSSTKVLLTKDGGDTWEQLIYTPSMSCMQFISPTVGFGGGNIVPSNDRGLYKWIGDLSDSDPTNTSELIIDSDKASFYPNPAINEITYTFDEITPKSIEIFDMKGQKIKQISTNSPSGSIDISNMEKGMYVFKTLINDNINTQLIIKH